MTKSSPSRRLRRKGAPPKPDLATIELSEALRLAYKLTGRDARDAAIAMLEARLLAVEMREGRYCAVHEPLKRDDRGPGILATEEARAGARCPITRSSCSSRAGAHPGRARKGRNCGRSVPRAARHRAQCKSTTHHCSVADRCRSITGTTSSAIRRSPMPSSTASFIMLTGSTSPARAFANGVCSNYPLDPATKGKDHPNDPQRRAAGWPTSDRKPGRLRIGKGGRLHIGMHGRLRRNPQCY